MDYPTVEEIKRHFNVFAEGLRSDFRMVIEGLSANTERLDKVEVRLDRVEGRLERVELRLDGVEGRLERVEFRLDGVEGRLERVEVRLDGVENGLGGVKAMIRPLIPRSDA